MKSLVAFSSLLVFSTPALSAPLHPRQGHGGHGGAANGGHGGANGAVGVAESLNSATGGALSGPLGSLAALLIPEKKALSIKQLTPKYKKPGAKRVIIRHGPFVLRIPGQTANAGNGKSMDPAGTAWTYRAAADWPRDVSVLAVESNVVWEDGKRASITTGAYTHHLAFIDITKKSIEITGCANASVAAAASKTQVNLLAGGAESKNEAVYASRTGTLNAGYYVGKRDVIMMAGDVVNYKNVSQTVWVDTEMEYIPGKVEYDVQVETVNVRQCDGAVDGIVDVPKNATTFGVKGTNPVLIQRDGVFQFFAGHLHDGGVDVSISLNGEEICTSKAIYGGEGSTRVENGKTWETIATMGTCEGEWPVKKGDQFQLWASYDLVKHPSREQHGGMMAEEMALMGGSFAFKSSA